MFSKSFVLAAAVIAAFACNGSSNAHACSDTEVYSRGDGHIVDVDNRGCNRTRIAQRRFDNGAEVWTRGNGNETNITQLGSHQHVWVGVNGNGHQTHVFTGHCPPGSRPQTIYVNGDGRRNVFVPACR